MEGRLNDISMGTYGFDKTDGKPPGALPRTILLLLVTGPILSLTEDLTTQNIYEENYGETDTGGQLELRSETIISTTEDPYIINLPDETKAALIARKVVHGADWASMSFISQEERFKGLPISFFVSTSDGPKYSGQGIPFFYLARSQWEMEKVLNDGSNITLFLSNTREQCLRQGLVIEDYRCHHVLLIGKIKEIKPTSVENRNANMSFFSRHSIKLFSNSNDYVCSKLDIKKIFVYYHLKGPMEVSLQDYFKVSIDGYSFASIAKINELFLLFTVLPTLLTFSM